jgi:hypothetical protein
VQKVMMHKLIKSLIANHISMVARLIASKATSYLALDFIRAFSLNESDSQRIAIMLTIICFNRRNQQENKIENTHSR